MTQRIIDAADITASLAAAQEALQQSDPGSRETWILPAGEFHFAQGMTLGASQRSLYLQGQGSPSQKTTFIFSGNGAVDGDLVTLDLIGGQLGLDKIEFQGRAAGRLTGIRIQDAEEIRISDVTMAGLRGEEVTAFDLQGTTAHLSDITVTDIRAGGGNAMGLRTDTLHTTLSRAAINHMTSVGRTCGMEILSGRALAAHRVRIEQIRGRSAEGASLRVSDTAGKLTLLDIRSQQINADGEADGDQAVGVTLVSAGDMEIRSLSTSNIRGACATGIMVAGGARIDWLAGHIDDIRGISAGAAGVRMFASPSQESVSIRDLQIEAVRAALTGSRPNPPASWSAWGDAAFLALRDGEEMPPWPPADHPEHQEDVVGIHVDARVSEFEPWIEHSDPGPVRMEQCILHRISGTALQIAGDTRDVEIRGVEAWTTLRSGWVDGERVLLAQLTWHRHHIGFAFGPCLLSLANCLFTGIDEGPAVIAVDPSTDLQQVVATYASRASFPLRAEPEPLPYSNPGPASGIPPSMLDGALAPQAPVDLRLLPGHALHAEAERVPGDPSGELLFLGAHPPDADSRCDLRDPLPPDPPIRAPIASPSPVVDYRARDARSLMALMTDRAHVVMPQWTDAYPSDLTTMLMELLANRLDHLAYKQECAVTEGYLSTALTRLAVTDHARLVDYEADEGLSATAMLRFHIDEEGIDALALRHRYDLGERLIIPRNTLVVNPDAREQAVIFCTEDPLALDYALSEMTPAEDIEPRAHSAELQKDLISLETGRWLMIMGSRPETPSHVVRVTRVELGTDSTRIFWDPRRPAPARYTAAHTRIYGNVIPAHHGLPLTSTTSPLPGATQDLIAMLQPWREKMSLCVDNSRGDLREVELPLDPVSIQSPGWPFPEDSGRQGEVKLEVCVNTETWDHVASLCTQGPNDECYVLRPSRGNGAALRFGDNINGAALPNGLVDIDINMRVGLGEIGNVGPDALTRILSFGDDDILDTLLPAGAPDRLERIHRHLRATNPIAAVGGRDPEPLARIRYRAPRKVRDTLSAVVPQDYERLLASLKEVATAHAAVVDVGLRRVVRVTVLLKDEDLLTGAEVDPDRDAERIRRWALTRSYLESIRLLGFDVELVPPRFVPLDIDIIVDAMPWAQADQLILRIQEALAGAQGLFDPDISGLGGDVHVDAIHQAVLRVHGVAAVRVARLRRLMPHAIEYADSGTLPIGSDEVAIIRHPYGLEAENGIVTVSVCGGIS